jgi:hypothetical protein
MTRIPHGHYELLVYHFNEMHALYVHREELAVGRAFWSPPCHRGRREGHCNTAHSAITAVKIL